VPGNTVGTIVEFTQARRALAAGLLNHQWSPDEGDHDAEKSHVQPDGDRRGHLEGALPMKQQDEEQLHQLLVHMKQHIDKEMKSVAVA